MPGNRLYLALYIEDNPMNVDLAFAVFEDLPYIKLLAAADAESGIELALAHKPDLIIMDINLPGMDGMAAAREIRQNKAIAAIPIIALSAAAMHDEINQAMDSGFLEYIVKPINIVEFIALIKRILPEHPADN